jgi:hypothetical protein
MTKEEAGWMLQEMSTAANIHRLAQLKVILACCGCMECEPCKKVVEFLNDTSKRHLGSRPDICG